MAIKQKFATQVDPELLARTRALAGEEGRLLQSLVEEALVDLLAKRKFVKTRSFATAYQASIERF